MNEIKIIKKYIYVLLFLTHLLGLPFGENKNIIQELFI